MKNILLGVLLSAMICGISVTGCKPDPSLDEMKPDSTMLITFNIPEGWPQPTYLFSGNPLTQKGFELGRKLFYEVRLSRDNTIACNSCHEQFSAFSHLDHALSHGIEGRFGVRNTPGIFNMAWKPAYFWDGNEPLLDNQPLHPIENHVEMDLTIGEAVDRLNADATYRQLFQDAFGNSTISSSLLFKALAQFMGSIVSADSKYDQYTRGEAGGSFTTAELNGLNLFRDKCAGCHKEPLLTDYSYRNNGLQPSASLKDSGRAAVTHLAEDLYRFMVPSLRNVALTRPYMHDGRFSTLEAVLQHYRTGIVSSATTDAGLVSGISMTDAEQADIIIFLQTLSDKTLLADKRFSKQ